MNTRNRTRRVAIVLLLPAGLASCTVGPEYQAPTTDAPGAWVEPATAGPDADPQEVWWRSFGDETLDTLIADAARANTDLRVATARLREARAQRGIVAGALYPEADAAGSYSNSHFSENGFLKGLGGGGGAPGAIVPGQEINLYEAGVDASWELDIFGHNRRAVEAADADVQAAQLDLRDMMVAVNAEVADGYVQLRGLQARLALARDTVNSRRQTADVVREQTEHGVADQLDLARAESQLAQAESRIPELESAARVAVRRLEVLTGAMPGALDGTLDKTAPLPHPPEVLAVSIPSEVLRRRPDVRAAERRIAAASARIGVATSDLFPRFSLTGSFGLQSQELGELPEGDSRFWAIGPAVRWPILDFGRIRSNIAAQNARQQQAEAAYEGTVLQALSDVEVSLVRVARERRRLERLTAASEAASRAAAIADEQYRSGVLDYLGLLDTQRTEYQAADAVAQSRAALASDTVGLYRALGGGWEKMRQDEAVADAGQ